MNSFLYTNGNTLSQIQTFRCVLRRQFYRPSFPPSPGSKVRIADSEKLKKFFHFDESGLHLGNVEYHDLSVKLNLSRMLKKHLAILAMSGSGKCGDYNLEILLSNGRTIKLGELVDNHLKIKK